MLEQALTGTRLISLPSLSAADLDAVIAYAVGDGGRVCAVVDSFPVAARDALVTGLAKLRPVEVLDRVVPDPRVEDIMAMAARVRATKPDAIVAIGGGSTLDSAKALAMLAVHEGDLEDYLGPEPRRKIGGKGTLMIAVPTTAGTGSEVTRFGVYTARGGRKYTLAHPALQPDIAILAAALTHSLPPAVTAATGIDALSHALETIWNRNATPASDRAATGAATSILEWLPVAYQSARTGGTAGRAEMLEAACRAGTAFNRTGTAMVHALSFILSEEWHVPHGVACAFTLEDAARINGEDPEIARKLGRILGAGGDASAGAPERLAERIVSLKRAVGLPFTFRDVGAEIGADDIGRLFAKAFGDPKMRNNAVPVEEDRVYELLRSKL
ncbi:MAG TPA: iron-containing alcohol dehydrogenase [Verrucomicrobiae bacterium]|nr:iron-containing alcohol dehydrogenase [Verrucomicrobiae bacterium]